MMPSDNLGVGVFPGDLASSANPPATQAEAFEAASVTPQRSAGMHWIVASALLLAGDAAVVAGVVWLMWRLGAIPDGLRAASVLGLPLLVAVTFLSRGLYGRTALAERDFPLYAMAAGWVHALGLFLLLRVVIVPAAVYVFGGGAPGLAAGLEPMRLMGPLLLLGVAVGFAAIVLWRLGWRLAGPQVARPIGDRVVIVGDLGESTGLLARLRAQSGVEVVGLIEPTGVPPGVPPGEVRARVAGPKAGTSEPRRLDGVPVMTGLHELLAMVRGGLVDTALVTPDRRDDGRTLSTVLDHARVSTLNVKVLPDVRAAGAAPASLSRIGDLPVIELYRRPLGRRALVIKRAEDLIFGSAMLVMLLPVIVAIAAAIKLTSRGPIFFRQPRVGLNGNVFEMFKFRSMYHHAADAGAVRQTGRGDPRVTRVGAVLRRHSLDELPQILNVLRGDMSIVGPRPHALAMTAQGMALEEAAKDYPARFRMKPGITGWAQTNGWRGNCDTVEKLVRRVEHDLHYIENWSLGLDLLILRKTVSCVISDETAY